MSKRLLLLFLAVVLTAFVLGHPTPAKAGDVYVAMKVTYYSDATHTVVVGVCQYPNCHQFVLGNWTCTGTVSSYGVSSNYQYCPPPV
jgi:hypothetical protein